MTASGHKPKPARAHRGFTLLETLVVITIVALIAAVMAPSLISTPNTQLRSAAQELVSALRDTRLQALRTRGEAALALDTSTRLYQVPGTSQPRQLDSSLQLQLTTAEREMTGSDSGNIRFYADGSSTGGRITVSNGKLVQHVDVEWLTGRVRLRDDL